MNKKNILITGGAGFVGSNLAIFLKQRVHDVHILCFDNLSRSGSEFNVDRLHDHGIHFVKGDVRDRGALFQVERVDVLVDCAAEPSILAAFSDPRYVVDTNLCGTINCLELARRDQADFVFFSTNRVYSIEHMNQIPCVEENTRWHIRANAQGIGYSDQGINEAFPLCGARSLYGATKLCGEHLLTEYIRMFSMRGVIDRIGVIAGPWQMGRIDQGIVGYWMAQHKFRGKLSYIGSRGPGKQVRDVVHVDDVCELILWQLDNMDRVNGLVFNVGGGLRNSFSLTELTERVRRITGISMDICAISEDRKDDIKLYITDHTRISAETGWQPKKDIDQILHDINEWMNRYSATLEPILR